MGSAALLWPDQETDPFAELFDGAAHAPNRRPLTLEAPTEWRGWLTSLFPQHVKFKFADRHEAFWEWVWSIELDSAPRPFIAIWPRGGAKSTSAELAVAALGLRGKRKYVLYVRETQEQADKSVANIAALLESKSVASYYPEHGDRMVSKFGNSRGWRRNRLRTAGGLTVDAIGLDTAARGVKVEEQRPDLEIYDDIDDKHDSAGATARKIKTITTSLLPAGSSNAATLGIQNLIIPDGVFSRLADGRADFLAERIVSGPYPAVEGLETQWEEDEETGTRQAVITAGVATWDGQNLDVCQRDINKFGLGAFLQECQHDVSARKEGLALKFDNQDNGNLEDLTDADVRELVKMGRVFGGLDFGAWRFAFTLYAVDRAGVVFAIDEYFSQREELGTRAKALIELCAKWGITTMIPIWGDAANPQDIMEINSAFRKLGSKLRVVAVAMANKIRGASVERINKLLVARAFLIRRTIGNHLVWREGFNAGSAGTEMKGSRLLWEIGKWAYPIPEEGKAQKQDPDDHTADGADGIASMRYALMSWLKPAKKEDQPEHVDIHDPQILEHMGKQTLGQAKEQMKKNRKLFLKQLGF
jgi:hypothetical protein